ncbi:MAG: alkaline phosphatase [Bacteroidota bacterium]
MKRFLWLLIILSFAAAASPSRSNAQSEAPENIIFLIGDGMGAGQLTVMKTVLGGIALDAFPVAGFSMTQSLNDFATESAAGGTALSTGERTNNYMISQRPDGTALPTLLEAARVRGKGVGVVVTSSLTHATPASFLSHVPNRKMEFDIALQIAGSGADVLIGGGRRFFLPQEKGGDRKDGRNVIAEMQADGYVYADTIDAALPARGRLLWLLADEGLPSASKRAYSLKDLVKAAIALLSQNGNGFVLVVEGSQIDWAAHDNDFAELKAELRDFDGAISAALSFAEKNAKTLLVVTADHETGGLAVIGNKPDGSDMQGKWIWGEHTGNMVPVFAMGPGSYIFGGIHRNNEIGRMLHDLLKLR